VSSYIGTQTALCKTTPEGLQHFRVFEFAQFSTSLPQERDGSDICRNARHRFGTPDGSRYMVTLDGLSGREGPFDTDKW
jgi:hypothetical protein